jgi:hypothetical protein
MQQVKFFSMLIIDLNNIHELNILRYTLLIFPKRIASVFNWHTLPYLCPNPFHWMPKI